MEDEVAEPHPLAKHRNDLERRSLWLVEGPHADAYPVTKSFR